MLNKQSVTHGFSVEGIGKEVEDQKKMEMGPEYGPTFTKRGHNERAVYLVRERRFIST